MSFFEYFSPSIYNYVILSSILFAIGVMGVLIRKNIIIIFMAIELMLNAVNLLLVGFSVHHASLNPQHGTDAQVFVFFIMAVAAAEITVGLAILMMIFRNTGSVSIDSLKNLKW